MKKINWKLRFKNPLFWIQITSSALMSVMLYNQVNPQDLYTWSGLFKCIFGLLQNPYLLGICLMNIFAASNDPTTSGFSDRQDVLNYEKLKKQLGG